MFWSRRENWINLPYEWYGNGNVVRLETGDSYIKLEPDLYEEVKSEYGEKFVHDKDYIILYKMEDEECF